MRYVSYLVPGLAVALCACAAGPDYQSPELPLPAGWHSPSDAAPADAAAPQAAEPWWTTFGDDKLHDLIKRALANNHDIKTAEAHILEARASRQSTASALYPQLQGDAQASRGNQGYLTFNKTANLYQPEFDASYEIDLFGGNRRRVEAQDATIAAREADLRDVTITLIAEVARTYMDWRQLQQQWQLAHDTASAQQQLLAITQAQNHAGTTSNLDVSQAETLYKNTEARVPEIERQREAVGYALSVLLGETPGPLNDELQPAQPLPVPAALTALNAPADVITHRPDVERAERQLAAATALQGAAISEIYPKITLSALFGIQDISLDPRTTIWSLGSGIAVPLLNFGKIEGQIKAADARQVEAFHSYHQTVLQALANVETSLSNLSRENQRRQALQDAADSADNTLTMAMHRYEQGLTDFTTVLQTQQQLYSARSELVASQADTLKDIIALHKALGD